MRKSRGMDGLEVRTPDLGPVRGRLSDWVTQLWVRLTGRRVSSSEHPWLDAPVGDVDAIGSDFFERHARQEGLSVDEQAATRGLLSDFSRLAGPELDAALVSREIVEFYELTSGYELDVWSEWSGIFRPFGRLLSMVFSRRLRQLNVPLSALDTSRGMSSRVLYLRDSNDEVRLRAWVRELRATRRTLYAGSYGTVEVPGHTGACVKVCFPLPNGSAVVVMWPESAHDGSLVLHSEGTRFGDPGFYFVAIDGRGRRSARYVRSFRERIHVFVDEAGELRTNHELSLFGLRVLKLHYRMRRVPNG